MAFLACLRGAHSRMVRCRRKYTILLIHSPGTECHTTIEVDDWNECVGAAPGVWKVSENRECEFGERGVEQVAVRTEQSSICSESSKVAMKIMMMNKRGTKLYSCGLSGWQALRSSDAVPLRSVLSVGARGTTLSLYHMQV
jgi:hypothetical protein